MRRRESDKLWGWYMPLSLICILILHDPGFAWPTITVRIGTDVVPNLQRRLVSNPIITDFFIEIDVPSGEELWSVRLNFDDTCIPGGDASLNIYNRDTRSCLIKVTQNFTGRSTRYTFESFDLPLWKVGENTLRIDVTVMVAIGEGRTIDQSTSFFVFFSFDLPSPSFGIGKANEGGPDEEPLGTSFSLRGMNIPIFQDECPFIFCKDTDQDGLLDLWENIAVEVLRPLLFHRDFVSMTQTNIRRARHGQ